MSTRIAVAQSDRVDGPFLRVIGSLALETHELRRLRSSLPETPADTNLLGWCRFADHLIETVTAVLDGAASSTGKSSTIPMRRDGVLVPVSLDYLTKLATKVQRHARVALAMGIGGGDPADDLSLAV